MNWYSIIERLYIGSELSLNGVTVKRVANNRFAVNGTFVGGKNYSYRLAVAKAVEVVTGQPQPEPCARCGCPRVSDSYCRRCFNRIHAEGKRKRR
jgi:hypothetical protein